MSDLVVGQYLQKHKTLIDQEVANELERRLDEAAGISPHLLKVIKAMQELSVGGKRLRGLLTILGYELAGGKVSKEIYKAAAVMELFHLGLLIQDDVMDRDKLRRGVPTVHARYDDLHLGEAVAICAGDLTFGWGMEMLAKFTLPKESVLKAMQIWGKYFARVGYGQILDVIGNERGETNEKEILDVLQLKSGEYSCVLPLQLGAALAGGDEKLATRLKNYGMELGWVFQLRDDWLSEYGDSSKTGKPVGNDRREGRKSYATMYGKEATEQTIAEHLAKGKETVAGLQGVTLPAQAGLKVGGVLTSLLEWVATRNN